MNWNWILIWIITLLWTLPMFVHKSNLVQFVLLVYSLLLILHFSTLSILNRKLSVYLNRVHICFLNPSWELKWSLKFTVEVWSWSFKFKVEVWRWSLKFKLKFEIEVWNWSWSSPSCFNFKFPLQTSTSASNLSCKFKLQLGFKKYLNSIQVDGQLSPY